MSAVRPLLILQTGNSVPLVREPFGEFDSHFRVAIGELWQDPWHIVDVRNSLNTLPSEKEIAGVIITGSASSVTERAPWMLALESYLRHLVEYQIPMLGVCFGHQILASSLGGSVRRNPAGRRIGTACIRRVDTSVCDRIFEGLPSHFEVNLSHQDHVATEPKHSRYEVCHLASAEHDRFHAFGVGPNVRGVQFHPEFDSKIVRGYIQARYEALEKENLNPQVLYKQAQDTWAGPLILRNFIRHFVLPHTLNDALK